MKEELYSLDDFIYKIEKYNNLVEKNYTQAQIAYIIGQAMVNFFEDSDSQY